MKKEVRVEVKEIIKNSNNTSQKKHLATQKQLRVWLEAEKFEKFKKTAYENNTSMYRLINDFINTYLLESQK